MTINDIIKILLCVRITYIPRAYTFVVNNGMMFRVIICKVRVILICPSFPVNLDELVCLLIAKPIVSHVPCLTFAKVDVVVNKTGGGGIVGF